MPPFPFLEPVERMVPAAVIRVWDRAGSPVCKLLETIAGRGHGILPLAEGVFAALPLPGDPALFDRAVAFASAALPGSAVLASPPAGDLQILIVPGGARIGAKVELVEDPLLAELATRRPELERGRILLTTHASHQLEGTFDMQPSRALSLSGGRQIPLVAARPRSATMPAWRNTEVLSRVLKWVPRPELEGALRERWNEPLLRIEGPFGVGKTRLVWEQLRSAGESILWRNAAAFELPALERELAAEPNRPLMVVYDHLDAATPSLWAEIEELLKHPGLGRELRPLFVGRPGTAWPAALAASPVLRVDGLEESAWNRFTAQLFRGLSLPEPIAAELASGAAGNPFALEEALIFLVRDRKLRQVYGSFFFSGAEGSPSRFQLSRRYLAHVEAEALRLGAALPLRLLTQIESAVPPSELASAVVALGGERPAADWDARYVAAGLLADAEGPWGQGRVLASRALRAALVDTLPEASANRLRFELGELLSARAGTGEELWSAYGLLAGSDAGARTLLAAATGATRLPREPLFTALRHELACLGDRPADPELEIELLWLLLPLARRMGRLNELSPALERGSDLAREQPARFLAIASLRADLAQMAGRYAEAETVLRQALAVSREGGESDNRRKELLLVELGRVLIRQGKSAEATELFTRTLAVAEKNGRKGLTTTCRFFLGNIALHEFRLDEAAALHRQALADRRAQGTSGVAASLSALGAVALAQGNTPGSLACFEEARALLAADRDEAEEAFALVGVGRAMSRLGDVASAAPLLRRALALREKRDDGVGEAIARLALADNLLLLDQPDNALLEARKAHFALSLQPAGEALADSEQLLGRIQTRLRRPEAALAQFDEAAALHKALGKGASRLTDLAYRIVAEIARGQADAVAANYAELAAGRAALPKAPALELHEYHLYLAAEWLESKGRKQLAPLEHLERSYDELMRQTSYLDKSRRQRFLLEVPLNRAIVEAGTRRDLSLPAF